MAIRFVWPHCHGRQILAKLDVAHVLSRPETCASLRTLFGWCWRALGWTPTDQYQLVHGSYSDVTKGQNPPAGP